MKKASALIGAVLLAGFSFSGNAQAASEDECAIWLCLPGAFPATCEAAQAAMASRVKDGKSPLPSFSSCSDDGTNHGMHSNHGFAAYIPEREVCTSWDHGHRSSECRRWEVKPERYVRGQRCRVASSDSGEMIPDGCTRTYRYVEIFANNEMQGDTYYW